MDTHICNRLQISCEEPMDTTNTISIRMYSTAASAIHLSKNAAFQEVIVDMKTTQSPHKHWWEHIQYVALGSLTSLNSL